MSRDPRQLKHWVVWFAMIASIACSPDPEPVPPASDARSDGATRSSEAAPRPRLIVLLSLDTLRADRLGLYGHRQFTSPNLDMLGGEGVVFDDANSPAPWTLPAHASILTGRNPAAHGVMGSAAPLSGDIPTLASMLRSAGFSTGAVVSVDWLRQKPFELTRDFEQFHFVETTLDRRSANSLVTDTATDWIAAIDQRPLFLFVHYYDLHTDYTSDAGYESLFVTPYDGVADGTALQLQKANLPLDYIEFCRAHPGLLSCQIGYLKVDESIERVEYGADDVRHLEELYDASIRQLDTELARFFAQIRDAGLWDQTLIVVTSDHGEEFGEHGQFEHYLGLNQEVLHVPLILKGPSLPRGLRVTAPVSTIDIVPTVLGLAGVPVPDGIEGLDLAPLWQSGQSDGVAARFRSRSLPGEASGALQYDDVARPFLPFERSLRQGRYKLIRDENAKTMRLYDLAVDPGERLDIANREPEIAARLLEELEARELGLVRQPGPRIELDPEEARRLRALGYMP